LYQSEKAKHRIDEEEDKSMQNDHDEAQKEDRPCIEKNLKSYEIEAVFV
jgi:hypothetical protein